jgi:hypothetical protein
MGSHRAGRRVRVGTVAWSLLAAIAWSGSAVAPIARADDQIGSSALNVHGADFVPLTKEELRIVALKEEAARRQAASLKGAGGGGVAPATCPLTVVNGGTPATACPPCWGYLSTTPRQQQKSYYCGPTAVQVVSNYVWGVVDKYTQQYISTTWTNTDNDGQTYVWRVRYGLNAASAGHLPANFVYAEYQPPSPSDWHNKLRTDVGTYAMPQVVGVAPHDVGATRWLYSWPTPHTTGHYIVLTGWNGVWDGTESPTVNYDDGSGGYGGSTGAFSDPATTIWYTITKSNPYHAADWIIW